MEWIITSGSVEIVDHHEDREGLRDTNLAGIAGVWGLPLKGGGGGSRKCVGV